MELAPILRGLALRFHRNMDEPTQSIASPIPRKNQLHEWLELHQRPGPPVYGTRSVTPETHHNFIGSAAVTVADGSERTFEATDSATTVEEAEALAAAEAYRFLMEEYRTNCAGRGGAAADPSIPLLDFLERQGLKPNKVDLQEICLSSGLPQDRVVEYDSGEKAAMVAVADSIEEDRRRKVEYLLSARVEREAEAMAEAASATASLMAICTEPSEDESAAFVGGFYLSSEFFAKMQEKEESSRILAELGVDSADDLRTIDEPQVAQLCQCLSPLAAAKLRQCLAPRWGEPGEGSMEQGSLI